MSDCWQLCDKEHTAASAGAVAAGSSRSGSRQQYAVAAAAAAAEDMACGSRAVHGNWLRILCAKWLTAMWRATHACNRSGAWNLAGQILREMVDSRVCICVFMHVCVYVRVCVYVDEYVFA